MYGHYPQDGQRWNSAIPFARGMLAPRCTGFHDMVTAVRESTPGDVYALEADGILHDTGTPCLQDMQIRIWSSGIEWRPNSARNEHRRGTWLSLSFRTSSALLYQSISKCWSSTAQAHIFGARC